MEKLTWKCEKLYFKNIFALFIQLYIAKVQIGSRSGENFPDPAQEGPDPQPWWNPYLNICQFRDKFANLSLAHWRVNSAIWVPMEQ